MKESNSSYSKVKENAEEMERESGVMQILYQVQSARELVSTVERE